MKEEHFVGFYVGLVVALLIVGIAITIADDRVYEIYTGSDIYYLNSTELSVTTETGRFKIDFDTYEEAYDWVAEQTANDAVENHKLDFEDYFLMENNFKIVPIAFDVHGKACGFELWGAERNDDGSVTSWKVLYTEKCK